MFLDASAANEWVRPPFRRKRRCKKWEFLQRNKTRESAIIKNIPQTINFTSISAELNWVGGGEGAGGPEVGEMYIFYVLFFAGNNTAIVVKYSQSREYKQLSILLAIFK